MSTTEETEFKISIAKEKKETGDQAFKTGDLTTGIVLKRSVVHLLPSDSALRLIGQLSARIMRYDHL